MRTLKSMAEWYLGVPPSPAGEQTRWQIQTANAPVSPILLLIVLAALAGVVIWIYLRDARNKNLPIKFILIGLRLGVIGLLVLFCSQLSLRISRTGLPTVAIMIDDSASMSLNDYYQDPEMKSLVKELQRKKLSADSSRMQLIKGLLRNENSHTLKELEQNYQLQWFRFSDNASRLTMPGSKGSEFNGAETADYSELLRLLNPIGKQTRPGPALDTVLDQLRSQPPAAVIVFTDGTTTTTSVERLSQGVAAAIQQSVPVFPVGVGGQEAALDLQLLDLRVDEYAFVEDPILFSAKLQAFGYPDQKVEILLRNRNTGKTLARKAITTPADDQPVTVQLTHIPMQAGDIEYELGIKPLATESNVQNNSVHQRVQVRAGQIKVLLADRLPRYEFRFLKHLLEREKSIQLHTVLQDSDLGYAEQDSSARTSIPVAKSEILNYDVIILGDIDTTLLSKTMYASLLEFVSESGGGLIFIAGAENKLHHLAQTELHKLLPYKQQTSISGLIDLQKGFRVKLSPFGGISSPLFRFDINDTRNKNIWKTLPKLYGLQPLTNLKSGSIVLAETSKDKLADAVTDQPTTGNLPVITLMRYGSGKVLYHATDETWRWRYRHEDLYFGRYWIQAIRYLSRPFQKESNRYAELTTDLTEYEVGDDVQLQLQIYDKSVAIGEAIVLATHESGKQHQVMLKPSQIDDLSYRGTLSQTDVGSYRASLVSPNFPEPISTVNFRVIEPKQELKNRQADLADLKLTAKQSGGIFYNLANFSRITGELPPGNPVLLEMNDPIPLWNRWEMLFLFLGILVTEWIIRQKNQLL